ncbi:3-deoxy-D-arabino-heptulosonate 7-phosphate synthase [Candidimonas sp. SYP-B2681]|uniref:3-deoxy-D-arabino-heptulosonate 7-phosphate synthase n=1 Tax=Candidimonas sp. SYP-B2681 TaxID=2497686 RepID=UPI000F86C4D8|nr:3-deoxy-D-arabino-heptulosonate 7-phosphate synthase [Candidimonas sp. SYP-B2681]RTZ43451.1 3-deoxy-D-arabino-heptulosonate 7-phosphate synthase [Candidimonas sp. SYP-B2681]
MSLLPPSSFLDKVLSVVARRYRLPEIAAEFSQTQNAGSATTLAIAIEQARRATVRGEVPDAKLKRHFIDALAQMIHEAMRAEVGDPAFQAMVLRHRAAHVREYASLSQRADQDRRSVHAAVNAFAHPGKQQRIPLGRQRDALAQLHTCASRASWSELFDTAQRLSLMPEIKNESAFLLDLTRLLDSPALERLRRLDVLGSDEIVRQYQSLWDAQGPRSGSRTALAQGAASQQRGAAVEALATQALEALAWRLNEEEGAAAIYRVVTSMRVPASIPGSFDRAKSEWDVVLLRRASTDDAMAEWDVCLLVEAKASVDAATTDLSRLLRGLRLLAHAEETLAYPFETKQGIVRLRGASLRALTADKTNLTRAVLYCSDAPAEAAPRLLSAASRMQLLSAQASVEFASTLASKQHADAQDLEPVWHELLESPRWGSVLHQYAIQHQVRELMVHTEDLLAAINGTAGAVRDDVRS